MAKFSDLPEEMQIKAFELLDAQSVKNAALVCSDWNKVISRTPMILEKFVLKLEPDHFYPDKEGSNEKFELLMNSVRRFTSIEASINGNIVQSRLLNVVKQHGPKLTSFKLYYSSLPNEKLLIELLKKMSELEKLHLCSKFLSQSSVQNDANISVHSVTLKNLKKLVVEHEGRLFEFLKAPALKDLQISKSGDLKSFLKTCPKLECLRFEDYRLNTLDSDFSFQLKKLTVSGGYDRVLSENSEKFLLSQAATVEALKAFHCNAEFHEIVLKNFKRLRVLDLNLGWFTTPPDFLQSLTPLPFLTDLKCDGFSCDIVTLLVLGNCPALLNLECHNYRSKNFLDIVADTSKNLESLTTSSVNDSQAKFRCLKTLTLTAVKNPDHLISFLKANPTVETLNINKLERRKLSNKFLSNLVNETSLEHVRVRGLKAALKEIYEAIKCGFGTWKTLTFCWPRRSSTVFCHFEFPKNAADWKPCEELFDHEWTDENGDRCEVKDC